MSDPSADYMLEALSRSLLRLVKDLCGMQASFITVIDWNTQLQRVILVDADPELPLCEGAESAWSQSLCRHMFSQGIQHSDCMEQLFPDTPGVAMGIRSFIVLPVVHGEKTLGTLCAASQQRRPLDDATRQRLQLISEAISLQLHLTLELQQLRQEAASRQQQISDLKELADTDPLTGLLNRRGFARCWQQLQSEPSGRLAVMVIDIDHFKRINDQHGHERGDQALQLLAAALRTLSRQQDYLARLGGDEFVLAARDSNATGLASLAQRLQGYLQEHCAPGSAPIELSIGIADNTRQATDDLLRLADQALYQSKQQGRNRIQISPTPEA